eukprot:167517_1
MRCLKSITRSYQTIVRTTVKNDVSIAMTYAFTPFWSLEELQPQLNDTTNILSNHATITKSNIDISRINEKDIESEFKDVDIIACSVLTGGAESVVKVLSNANKPILLIGYNNRNSIPAAIETREYFRDNLIPSQLINYHYDLDNFNVFLNDYYSKYNLNIYHKYLNLKFGLIGTISPWLINEHTLENIDYYKKRVTHISKDEFYECVKEIDQNKFENTIHIQNQLMKNANSICRTIPEKDIYLSSKIYLTMSELIKRYHLNGMTIGCFDLIGDINSTPCISLALINGMNNECCVSCEGELNSLLCMLLVKIFFNSKTFMANLTDYNVYENTILYSHCTAPLDFTKDNYDIFTHFESGKGVALDVNMDEYIHHNMKEKNVCVIKIKGRNVIIAKANIVNQQHSDCRCRTQIQLKLENDNSDAMKQFVDATLGNHHLICTVPVDQIKKVFSVLGFRMMLF